MEFLSLQETAAQPVARLNRTEALLVSVALHLLLVVLLAPLPRWLPGPLLAFLGSRPVRTEAADVPADTRQEAAAKVPEEKSRIPLKFAYVKVPDDRSVPPDRSSPLLSDRNRRARQEVPTPPSARRFSRDPHSEGDTIDRVRPDPSRPEGPETVDTAPTRGRADTGTGTGEAISGDRAARNRGALVGSGPAGVVARRETNPGAADENPGAGPAGADLREALSNLQSGEYKLTFDNPAYLKDGSYGTMSFDTQDFPWGDYARQIYVIIRNNWFARLPLAFREGIRGYACWRFVITSDGSVTRLQLVRSSSVPPFERAAADALRASSRLPPLPPEFPLAEEGVTFCFYYNMYPEEAE
jgi:TonB family protein